MEQSTIEILLDYIWVPIVSVIALLWSKINRSDLHTRLLAQSCDACNRQRLIDRQWRDEQRREILNKIDSHHKVMMEKLEAVETRIKNGH